MTYRHSALMALALALTVPLGACASYGSYGSSPYGNSPYGGSPSGYDPRYGAGSGRYNPGHASGGVILCESRDGRMARCAVDTRGGVRLVQRESRAACVQGRSWGHDHRGIWVSNGCRARFEVGGAYGSGRGYGRDHGRDHGGGLVVCESINERSNFCRVQGAVRQVQLVRQLSNAPCRQNVNWGFQRGGIWVDHGCRAEFRVY